MERDESSSTLLAVPPTEPAYAKLPALGVPFAPLLCYQTSASRARRLLCAHCLRPAAGMSEELCLSLGLRSRRALRAGGRAALPSAACLPDTKDVAAGGMVTRWCTVAATCSGGGVGGGGEGCGEAAAGGEAGGACLEAYCSDACRERDSTLFTAMVLSAGFVATNKTPDPERCTYGCGHH